MDAYTNLQHYKAHQLIIELQHIQTIEDSAERLHQLNIWQSGMERYGRELGLKMVG
jgi:hypothetical protein